MKNFLSSKFLLKNKIKKEKNPLKKLKEIKEDGILKKVQDKTQIRFVTIITSYEFINNMSRRHGISIDLARSVYESIKDEFQIAEMYVERKVSGNLSTSDSLKG